MLKLYAFLPFKHTTLHIYYNKASQRIIGTRVVNHRKTSHKP